MLTTLPREQAGPGLAGKLSGGPWGPVLGLRASEAPGTTIRTDSGLASRPLPPSSSTRALSRGPSVQSKQVPPSVWRSGCWVAKLGRLRV